MDKSVSLYKYRHVMRTFWAKRFSYKWVMHKPKSRNDWMTEYIIADYRYENEHKGYYVYFQDKRDQILGKFLSVLSNSYSIKEIDRILKIISFIEVNKSKENFEINLDKEFGCDFWEDEENEHDKGKRYGQRVGESTGYDLGRISTILYLEHYTSLLYGKDKNEFILISDYQPLETQPSFKTGDEMRSKLNWWKQTLNNLESKKLIPDHILNYPMTQEENIKELKSIDPNYEEAN